MVKSHEIPHGFTKIPGEIPMLKPTQPAWELHQAHRWRWQRGGGGGRQSSGGARVGGHLGRFFGRKVIPWLIDIEVMKWLVL